MEQHPDDPIARLFDEMAALQATHPELVRSRRFFELWEESCRPRPVPVTGPRPRIGGRELPLTRRGNYLVFCEWDPAAAVPVVVAENGAKRFRFGVAVSEAGDIAFSERTEAGEIPPTDSPGEIMEVIYDVIEAFLDQNPDADVFRIKKKAFVAALEALDDSYDPKMIRRIARFSAREVREWIRRAAADMALEDLSSQIHLPMGDHYGAGDALPETAAPSEAVPEKGPSLPERTHWTALREMEILLTLARLNDRLSRECRLPLAGGEVVSTPEPGRMVVRLWNTAGVTPVEGMRFSLHAEGSDDVRGSGVIGLVDDDALFVEIQWDAPESARDFDGLYLRPLNPAGARLLARTRELHDRLRDRPDAIAGALRSVLGLPSERDNAAPELVSTEAPSEPAAGAGLDDSQRAALAAAVDERRPVVTVQGPPGTGKTRVLARVLRALCARGRRLLVTAPSNTAVDNVCRAVADLPVLRFGQAEKVDAAVRNSCWAGDADQVDAFLKKSPGGRNGVIYAATHVRATLDAVIGRDFLERGRFDAVVFDEAGMSRTDEFLLCAAMGERVVLFGDQRQLPPFPLSGQVRTALAEAFPHLPAATRSMLGGGALEWLIRHRKAPRFLLQRSYRCQNPRLLRFSSTLFYHARVRTSETAEYFRLPFHQRRMAYPPSTLRFYCTSALPEAIRRETIVFDEGRVGIENGCEARIVRYVLLAALARHSLDQITVISPYRRQVRRIRKRLRYDVVQSFLPGGVTPEDWRMFLRRRIATVDSFQGGESDLVIISYVRSNPGGGIGFVDNPNRINVAHTRCRKELVIIGDLECLKRQARNDIFIRMERSFRRDGEILDVDGELLEEMDRC